MGGAIRSPQTLKRPSKHLPPWRKLSTPQVLVIHRFKSYIRPKPVHNWYPARYVIHSLCITCGQVGQHENTLSTLSTLLLVGVCDLQLVVHIVHIVHRPKMLVATDQRAKIAEGEGVGPSAKGQRKRTGCEQFFLLRQPAISPFG